MPNERLDKIIASMGQYSRREVKNLAREGKILIDGKVVREPDIKLDPKGHQILVNNAPFAYEKEVYLMLNKPAGVVTATRDDRNRTVMDLIPAAYQGRGLSPVGRLDKDTEGLLLITNDGALSHRLLSPSHHVDKEYFVTVEGKAGEDAVTAFAQGIMLADGAMCRPAVLKILQYRTEQQPGICTTDVVVTIQEGMYHQIKRMFGTLHMPVLYLKRIRMGSLMLDPALKPGAFRPLRPEEIQALQTCFIAGNDIK